MSANSFQSPKEIVQVQVRATENRRYLMKKTGSIFIATLLTMLTQTVWAKDIVHDAKYYILEAQNGEVWAVEDGKLDKKLAELSKKYGPPNIIHYMWDDQPPMSFGDPIYQKIRGYETPELGTLNVRRLTRA